MSEILGQQLVIENRPAAGGRPAAEFVANQPADGYTLFVGASGVMSIASAVYPKLAYHPTKSFIPLSMIANFPLILVSPVENPAKTVMELVAYAKANPEKSNYGTTSPAFTISTELLKLKTGMPARRDPAQEQRRDGSLRDAAAIACSSISDGPPAIPQINAGKVRALAVTGCGSFAAASERAEHGGGRRAGGQYQAVVRLLRAGKDAAGDRGEARSGLAPRHHRYQACRRSSRKWR